VEGAPSHRKDGSNLAEITHINYRERIYFSDPTTQTPLAFANMEKPTPTVVVIDDSTSVHDFFQRCLAPFDVRYQPFMSTAESMEYLSHKRPELLFLDIIMPDKDGLTFLQELRKMPGQVDTPVIMITSKDYAQDRMVAKNLGAVEFVIKPMRIETIRDLIVKYTGARAKGGHRTASG